MALVHHHALEVWRQAQAQVQRFQVRGRLVALAPHGQLLVARFDFFLASQISINSTQSCTCSPNGSPICSPCAPTCLTGTKWERRRSPFQFPKQKKGGRHLFQFFTKWIHTRFRSCCWISLHLSFQMGWGKIYILCNFFKWTVEH